MWLQFGNSGLFQPIKKDTTAFGLITERIHSRQPMAWVFHAEPPLGAMANMIFLAISDNFGPPAEEPPAEKQSYVGVS